MAAVVVAILLRTFVVATYSIPSGSMEPTLQIGDRIVVDKLAYHLHGVGTGNIVVFRTPHTEDCAGPPVADLVKRVIGLPGQTVSLSRGHVLHQRETARPTVAAPGSAHRDLSGPIVPAVLTPPSLRRPQGDVYVMGDNRPDSCDSRYWGPVPESTIVGKVDLRIWPLSRFALF